MLRKSFCLLITLFIVGFLNISNAQDWYSYPTYDEYLDYMANFESTYPSLCKIYEMGTSGQGRKLLCAKISDNVLTDEAEPEFNYTATIHGDELVGYMSMLHLIDSLLSTYSTAPRIKKIVDSIEIFIAPLCNPDATYRGGNHTTRDAQRSNVTDGFDLNRNYPCMCTDTSHHLYGRYDRFAAETEAIYNFDVQQNYVMSATVKGGTEAVIWPFWTVSRKHPDEDWFKYVANEYVDTVHKYCNAGAPNYMTSAGGDGIGHAYSEFWEAHGTIEDFRNYHLHCKSMTLELSLRKNLNESDLKRHWEYNYPSLLQYMEQCLYGINGIITDTVSGESIAAKVFIHDHDKDSSHVYSSLSHGDYYRPIYQGTYNVTFSAEGYHSKTITNVSVTNNSATKLDVQLVSESTPTLTVEVRGVNSTLQQGASVNIDNTYTGNTDANGQISFLVSGGTYPYTITQTDYQESTGSVVVSDKDTTLVVQLQGFTDNVAAFVANYSNDSVQLSWDATGMPADADSIRVVYNTNAYATLPTNGVFVKNYAVTSVNETIEISGLVEKTVYYFSAFVKYNNDIWSTATSASQDTLITPDNTAPANVTSFDAALLKKDSVLLTWVPSASTDADSVVVRYTRNGGFPTTQTTGTLLEAYSASVSKDTAIGLEGDSIYYFAAFVKDSAGYWSSASDNAKDSITIPDYTAPTPVTNLLATAITPTEMVLTWNQSTSPDAGEQIIIYSTDTITALSDTLGNNWSIEDASADSLHMQNLTSNTKYYFALFVSDELANWSEGAFTSSTTLNAPPICTITPITSEQSDTVTISFTLSDPEGDDLQIACSYSLDGTIWNTAVVGGVPNPITHAQYSASQLNAIWSSKGTVAHNDIDSLLFRVIPTDENSGVADTTIFHLDNYHGQAVALTTPTGVQSGNVAIPFVVTDTTEDSTIFVCHYSIDGVTNWSATQNIDVSRVGPAGYSGTMIWSTVADLGEQNVNTVRFRITPFDKWQNGAAGSTNTFHVNNENIPLVVTIIKEPTGPSDTVSMGLRIVAPNYNSVLIDSALFSIDGGGFARATLLSSTTIPTTNYDSATVLWDSKKDFTANAAAVTIKLVLKADSYSQSVTSQPFSLHNNATPTVSIPVIPGVQSGDVSVPFILSDANQDVLRVIARYSEDGVVWNAATVSGDTVGVGPANYANASLVWHSAIDFPNAASKLVWFSLTPFDLDTGVADSIGVTLYNQNNPPECIIDHLNKEQSGDVAITFELSDNDRDALTLDFAFSINGTDWTAATIQGLPSKIPDSLYRNGKKLTATWQSALILPNQDIETVYFKIHPSDAASGMADTIEFPLDNYHSQTISLTTNTGIQSGNVAIPYTVADTSGDSISFLCSYSTDGGANWQVTQNIDKPSVGPDAYTGEIVWNTTADISGANIPTVRFQVIPFDGWQNGVAGFTNNMHVDNSAIPLIVTLLKQPEIQEDTVTCAVKIVAPQSSEVHIDSAFFSINDGAKVLIDTLVSEAVIPASLYNNATILWASKNDFTANASNVKLHFVFKADTNRQGLTTDTFSLLNNEKPSVEIVPLVGVQQGAVPISFAVTDVDKDTIVVNAFYSEDATNWLKATVSGDTLVDNPLQYDSLTLTWNTHTDYPNTALKSVWFKVIPIDQDTGQADMIEIQINNQMAISGDFNNDKKIDFLDFSYVSKYWYASAQGINHPDSINELAPSVGTVPYLTITGDSLFDYKDLGVFVHLFYWSLGAESHSRSQPQIYYTTETNQKVSFLLDNNNAESVTLASTVKDVEDIVSCKLTIIYNQEKIAFKSFDAERGLLAQDRADIFSQVQEVNEGVSIGFTRLSTKRFCLSGSGDLATVVLKRKHSSAMDVTIQYTLINSNHEEVESGSVQVAIPEISTEEEVTKASLTVVPNPSKVSNRIIPFSLKHRPNAKQWVKQDGSGFIIRINVPTSLISKNLQVKLVIYDALGNCVAKISKSELPNLSHGYVDIFWSGHSHNGRRIGAGVYKLVVVLYVDNRVELLHAKIGVRR